MNRDKFKKYAKIVVKRGVALKAGQVLYIEADMEAAEFTRELVEQAYEAGAKEVGIRWIDKKLERIEFLKNGNNIEKTNRRYFLDTDYYSKKRAAILWVDSPDFETFKDIPASVLQKKVLADHLLRDRYYKNSKEVQTCAVCVPSSSWARKVYPGLKKREALEKLWEDVAYCMRLNEADPLAAWDKFVQTTRQRRKKLEEKGYREIHYKSRMTDLTLSLIDNARWYGGCSDFPELRAVDSGCAASDAFYIPNLPTEEVFTVPYKYSANGVVTSTKPLNFRGRMAEHFQLVFKDGKVVDYSAEAGEDVLKSILEFDKGACYLGEIAFVDSRSPIAMLNTVFYTSLYDENASCHIALGFGLEDERKSEEERELRGINHSGIHVDFMMGSEDMQIQGRSEDGDWETIFVQGGWAEEFTVKKGLD